MRMKRIIAGLLSFILLMGNPITALADETVSGNDTVSSESLVSGNDLDGEKYSVSANGIVSMEDAGSSNALSLSVQETETSGEDAAADIPSEYAEIVEEAQADLQNYLNEKDIFAIVYLTDSYAVKVEPDSDSNTVISVPSARTVQILGMEVAWDYWEEWEEYIPTVWYETQFYEGETLYSGYIEESYLAYSDELLLQWKNDWYMLFPMSNALYAASDSYVDVKQFPTSYQSALKKLKDSHPNWIFVPMNVNRNWDDCVTEQLGDYSWIYYNQPSEYLGTSINSKWNYASRAGIEFYMDPRNFLTESNIFQFEQNTYNSSYHTQSALQSFLNNTFMKGVVPDDSQGRTYAKIIFDSGKSRGLSPFNLAARVVQEQGVNGTSAMISGTYSGYEGYYNHYNIGASGTTNAQVFENGLARAKKEGWNTRVKSLEGGAAFIGNGYILQGQDTLYLQKFDVEHGSSSLHQYMQNIMAPYSEGRSMKTMYTNAGSLNSAFVFKIPVFKNMPNEYKFTINKTSLELKRGVSGSDTYTLVLKCNGSSVADGTVTFTSDKPAVATVSSSGKITAIGSGETVIRAKVKYDDMEEAVELTCKVKVYSPLQGISLNIEKQILYFEEGLPSEVPYLKDDGKTGYKYASKGELPTQVTLEVSYNPVDTTDSREVTWTVADEDIVSLEPIEPKAEDAVSKAVITAKAGGTTTVTAKVGNFTKTAEITVRIPMTEAKLNQNELMTESNRLTLHKGESTKITATYSPRNTTDCIEPVWTSENEAVAKIKDGMIIATGEGSTKLHAAIGQFDGSQSELTVNVTVEEYEVTFMDTDGVSELLAVPGEYGQSLQSLVVPEGRELPWTLDNTEDSYFIGWYTETNGKGDLVTPNTILYGDITLYPYFMAKESAEFYVKPIGSVTYTGAYIKPEVKVYAGDVLLTKGVDYTLSYKNNKAVNDGSDSEKVPTVIVTGKGQYAELEPITATFIISQKNISHIDVTAKNLSVEYTGKVQKLRPAISDSGRILQRNVDYTLEYPDTMDGAYREAGTYTVKITGIGNYTGTRYVYITITERVMMENVSASVAISTATISGIVNKSYTGDAITQESMVVTNKDKQTLTENLDYQITYKNNVNAGKASVIFTGINGYTGSVTKTFTIEPYDIAKESSEFLVELEENSVEYDKAGAEVDVSATYKDASLKEGTDYKVSYENNYNVTDEESVQKPTVVISGKGNFAGTISKNFTITTKDISTIKMTVKDVKFRNRKGFCIVEPVLTDISGRRLSAGMDYDEKLIYTYVKDTKLYDGTTKLAGSEVGADDIPLAKDGIEPEIKVTAKGIGNYIGEISCTYQILENTSWLEEVFGSKSEDTSEQNESVSNSSKSELSASQPLANAAANVVFSMNQTTVQLNFAGADAKTEIGLQVQNGELIPDKTTVTCENSTVAECFEAKVEGQTLSIHLLEEKQEQVPNGEYSFRVSPVALADGKEVRLSEQTVTVTVQKDEQVASQGTSQVADSVQTSSQTKSDSELKAQTAVEAIAEADSEPSGVEDIAVEQSAMDTADSDTGVSAEAQADEFGENKDRSISPLAIAVIVAGISAAGAVFGIRIRKKRKQKISILMKRMIYRKNK